MSMETYVLSNKQLSSMTEWQGAIDAAGFRLTLSTERPLSELTGFLPVRVSDVETGFECSHWDPQAIADCGPEPRMNRNWQYCLAFRWGGDLRALLAASMAAAAYAAATGGVVFDCEEARTLDPQEALQMARDIEAQFPAIEKMLQATIARLQQGT